MRRLLLSSALILAFHPRIAFACDLCAIYTVDEMRAGSSEGFSAAVAEQFTSFHRLQNDGEHVENTAHQSMSSSVTQVVGRYDFSRELGLQLVLPFINREFKRPEEGEIRSGSESGLGDMSVLGFVTPIRHESDDFLFRMGFRFGVKLPTGDSDRLKEESEEEHQVADEGTEHHAGEEDSDHLSLASSVQHGESEHAEEGEIESGVHGHDLALGSGSVDYILGWGTFIEKGRVFGILDLQYIFRTEGDFDYRYQNDLIWDASAGSFLYLADERSVSLKANMSGEYKGMDVFDGNKASDTGVNSMFLGPELNYTEGQSLQIQFGIDLPLFVDNTDLQIVPDYRLRAGVTYRF